MKLRYLLLISLMATNMSYSLCHKQCKIVTKLHIKKIALHLAEVICGIGTEAICLFAVREFATNITTDTHQQRATALSLVVTLAGAGTSALVHGLNGLKEDFSKTQTE